MIHHHVPLTKVMKVQTPPGIWTLTSSSDARNRADGV